MFYSRNPQYRDPVGAVEAGTSIHFRITVARESAVCSGARLVVTADTGGSQTLGLFWCGMNGDAYEWWECTTQRPRQGFTSTNSMWTRGTAACGWAAASTAPTSSIRRPRAGSSPCMRRASPRGLAGRRA